MCSPPPLLFCHNRHTHLRRTRVTVINDHGPATRTRGVAFSVTRCLTRTKCVVADNLTVNISGHTRLKTLTRASTSCRNQAVKIVNANVRICCPGRRSGLFTRVVRRNNYVVDRLLPSAPPRGRAFPQHGHLITNLDLTAVIARTAVRDNSLVATHLASRRNGRIFTVPDRVSGDGTRNYRRLVHRNTALVCRPRRIVRSIGNRLTCNGGNCQPATRAAGSGRGPSAGDRSTGTTRASSIPTIDRPVPSGVGSPGDTVITPRRLALICRRLS